MRPKLTEYVTTLDRGSSHRYEILMGLENLRFETVLEEYDNGPEFVQKLMGTNNMYGTADRVCVNEIVDILLHKGWGNLPGVQELAKQAGIQFYGPQKGVPENLKDVLVPEEKDLGSTIMIDNLPYVVKQDPGGFYGALPGGLRDSYGVINIINLDKGIIPINKRFFLRVVDLLIKGKWQTYTLPGENYS